MLLPATAGVLLALFAASLWVRRGALGYVRTQAAET
jgi:hypothetical protein